MTETATSALIVPGVGDPVPGAPPADHQDPTTGRPLRPLTVFGHDRLHAKAAPVTVFDDALAKLMDDMFASMYAAPGVGLAAPQVGVGLRLFTYDCGPGARGHVCNPVIETVPGELQDDDEGCLSVPGLYFPTVRAMQARVTGVDVDGHPVEVEGRELLARCLQHEHDHLDGMLYLDRLGGRIRRQAMREVREAEWSGQHWKQLAPRPRPSGEVGMSLAQRRAAADAGELVLGAADDPRPVE